MVSGFHNTLLNLTNGFCDVIFLVLLTYILIVEIDIVAGKNI